MKVKCIRNKGRDLREFEYKLLKKEEFGRFGASEDTVYGELEIGKEYLVMGVIMFESYVSYLVDDGGTISACPCQLFEITDDHINSEWYFRTVAKEEEIYPYVQAIWGYEELCRNKNSYKKLIIEKDESAERMYYKRKMELEK